MIEFSEIRTLLLVVELGSLAAAAKKLSISAAAVSKQLTRLEQKFGLQLLMRSTRKIRLTEVGHQYCQQCERILEEVTMSEELVSNMQVIPQGFLKVFSGRHFAATYIIPNMKEFMSRFPNVKVDLELGERMPDINAELIDVLIGMSLSATGEVIQKRIANTYYVFCASPSYLKEFGVPMRPRDLLKHRYITHSMREPDNELLFRNKEALELKPYLRVNDAEAMLKLAEEGVGIVKLHHYLVKEALDQGRLIELTSYRGEEIPLYVAFPQRRFISMKTRVFIDFIVEKIKS